MQRIAFTTKYLLSLVMKSRQKLTKEQNLAVKHRFMKTGCRKKKIARQKNVQQEIHNLFGK